MNKHNDHILHVNVCVCVCTEVGSSYTRKYQLIDMTKLFIAFRNTANAHKNDINYRPVGYIKLTIQHKGHRIPLVNFMSLVPCSCFYNQSVSQQMH
jgi:hypothetical protein